MSNEHAETNSEAGATAAEDAGTEPRDPGRIERIFVEHRAAGTRALMPFVCAGRPSLESLGDLLVALEEAGASIVEIGIPFSDPIADGPVIASAMHEALVAGVTPEGVFEAVAAARDRVKLGLVAMVSVSLVQRAGGPGAFVERAAEAGFDGFIFPDAPLEESDELVAAADAHGLTCSLLVSPSTPPERARAIAERCSGFVYLLARSGITGERSEAPEVEAPVQAIREVAQTPIAVGFGISTAEHVRSVVAHADAEQILL
ncbi:MAG: tryptophan synthase subunit alpha, partial [Planctomycetota bacterium]